MTRVAPLPSSRGVITLAVLLLAIAAFLMLSFALQTTYRLQMQNRQLAHELQHRAAGLAAQAPAAAQPAR